MCVCVFVAAHACLHHTQAQNEVAVCGIEPSTGEILWSMCKGPLDVEARISAMSAPEAVVVEPLSSTMSTLVEALERDGARIERVDYLTVRGKASTILADAVLPNETEPLEGASVSWPAMNRGGNIYLSVYLSILHTLCSKQENEVRVIPKRGLLIEQDGNLLDTMLRLPELAQEALAAVFEYLKKFNLAAAIGISAKMKRMDDEGYMRLNGNAIAQLDLLTSVGGNGRRVLRGSLFWLMNKTKTSFGARMLRSWILRPLLRKEVSEVAVRGWAGWSSYTYVCANTDRSKTCNLIAPLS